MNMQRDSSRASTVDRSQDGNPLNASRLALRDVGREAFSPLSPATTPRAGQDFKGCAGLLIEAASAFASGVLVTHIVAEASPLQVVALSLWTLIVYHAGWTVTSPIRRHVKFIWHSTATVFALAVIAVAIGVATPTGLRATVAAVITASAVALGGSVVRRLTRDPMRVLVVGGRSDVKALVSRWDPSRAVDVVAACVLRADGRDIASDGQEFDGPVIGSLDDIPATVERLGVGAVALTPGALEPNELRRLGWSLEGKPVHLWLAGSLDAIGVHRINPGVLCGRSIVELRPSHGTGLLRVVKTMADRVGGLVLLTFAAPVLLGLTLAVRLDTKGPAFFKQERVGLGGRRFTMYKLRTMVTDAEDLRVPLQRANPDKMLFKLQDDPRVTRIGQLLRRTSLDELPQLINVVKGDMSLIGPRPALPEEVARYDVDALRRLVVKPGLTGLWQVSGRSDLSWEESLALDLQYVDNWRLTDDFLIFGRTVNAVLRAKGAY